MGGVFIVLDTLDIIRIIFEGVLFLIEAWLIADLASGLFHWWEDRYGDPAWPILGKFIVQPNIEHHRYPTNTCRRSYWYRNGAAIYACVPIAAACFYFEQPLFGLAWLFFSQAQELHSWAHQRMNPFVRFFQQTGFFCSPAHHAVHHKRPYTQRYCVLSNWLNEPLHFVGFWTGLELLVGSMLGVWPNKAREIY